MIEKYDNKLKLIGFAYQTFQGVTKVLVFSHTSFIFQNVLWWNLIGGNTLTSEVERISERAGNEGESRNDYKISEPTGERINATYNCILNTYNIYNRINLTGKNKSLNVMHGVIYNNNLTGAKQMEDAVKVYINGQFTQSVYLDSYSIYIAFSGFSDDIEKSEWDFQNNAVYLTVKLK